MSDKPYVASPEEWEADRDLEQDDDRCPYCGEDLPADQLGNDGPETCHECGEIL